MDNSHNICFPKVKLRHIHLAIVILLVMLLSSCSLFARKDGPPDYDVDVSKIPNATPKAESLAKYGNMSSYRVFGKRYYTLKTSRGYDEVGTASWYGTKFHKARTSSGERYSMLGMTAAHTTLPLPTYVRVTNLKNHREVIVKVNDRGPFESSRIIDLSYVAAKKLGMLGHGTARVRVQAIDPATYTHEAQTADSRLSTTEYSYPSVQKSTTHHRAIYIQVGTFRSKSNAVRLQKKLIGLVSAPVQIANISAKRTLFRVQVGPIKDVATANKISLRLGGLGIKSNKRHGA